MFAYIALRHNFKNVHDTNETDLPEGLYLHLNNGKIITVTWDESEVMDAEQDPKLPRKQTLTIKAKGLYFDEEYANRKLDLIKDKVVYAETTEPFNPNGAFVVTVVKFSDNWAELGTNKSNVYTYLSTKRVPILYPEPLLVCYAFRPDSMKVKELNTLAAAFDPDQNLTTMQIKLAYTNTVNTTAFVNKDNPVTNNTAFDIRCKQALAEAVAQNKDKITPDTILKIYQSKDQIPENYVKQFPIRIIKSNGSDVKDLTFVISKSENCTTVTYTYYACEFMGSQTEIKQDQVCIPDTDVNAYIKTITDRYFENMSKPSENVICTSL